MSSNKNKNKSNVSKPQNETVVENETVVKKKGVTYFFKSEKEIGFKERNFFLPGTNQRYRIIAGAEIDEKTYNLFGEKAKKAFIKE